MRGHALVLALGLVSLAGCGKEQGVRPSALLGRPDVGVLRVGGPADLLVLDGDLRLRAVLRGGREIATA